MKPLIISLTLSLLLTTASARESAQTVTLSDLSVVQETTASISVVGDDRLSEKEKKQLLRLVNQARAQGRTCGTKYYGATTPVQWHTKLQKAATRHSKDMATNDFFSHTGSDGSTMADRVSATGYAWRTLGENIAAGYATPKQVIDGWLNSPGHCANIMNPSFKEMGVSKAVNPESTYRIYWTQNFGAR